MRGFRAVRGFQDVLPPRSHAHALVERIFAERAGSHGYEPAILPLVERAGLFDRSLVRSTVQVPPTEMAKEMFRVSRLVDGSPPEHRGDVASAASSQREEVLALRPEGTAGLVRAVLADAGSARSLPATGIKLRYCGPMFRYERPQKGRHRQFNQLGVEHLSRPSSRLSWTSDVEAIAAAHDFLRNGLAIGIDLAKLRLNTLGDDESAQRHREALRYYLRARRHSLSDENRRRLEDGHVMRILDAVPGKGEAEVLAEAPSILDFLSKSSERAFSAVCSGLDALAIPYVLDSKIVRGLDYYSHTVFEFVLSSSAQESGQFLGAQQATLLAGGRYDGLAKQLSSAQGEDVPAIGWAAGLERLAATSPLCAPILAGSFSERRSVAIIIVADNSEPVELIERGLAIAYAFRRSDITATVQISRAVGSEVRAAASRRASHAIILGSRELEDNSANVKNLDSKVEKIISFERLVKETAEENARSEGSDEGNLR